MSVETLEQKIAKQEEILKQLKAQKQAVIAREKKKQSEQKRKDETRRKILLGSLMLKKMEDEAKTNQVEPNLDKINIFCQNILKYDAKPIVDPSQYEVMKTYLSITKAMTDEELKNLETYILSFSK